MNEPTEVQILLHDGKPAFAVLPIAQYEALCHREDGKRDTLPHEVVKMNVLDGYSLLKAWRKWRGLSQTQLAEKAGLTQAQIARIENGNTVPRADTLLKLSAALGVSADLLWEIATPETADCNPT